MDISHLGRADPAGGPASSRSSAKLSEAKRVALDTEEANIIFLSSPEFAQGGGAFVNCTKKKLVCLYIYIYI